MKKISRLICGIVFLSISSSLIISGISAENGIKLSGEWLLQSSFLAPESGEMISSPDYIPDGWHRVKVPTTVLAGLVKNGLYPDPYTGMNNMKIPDAHEEFSKKYGLDRFSHLPEERNPWIDPYWFRIRFPIPDEVSGKYLRLHLDGINYRADVWLNGQLIAGRDTLVGMFGNWELDITGTALPGQDNVLAILIYPLDEPGLPGEPQFQAFGTFGLNGGDTGDIGKNVTMQSSVGWDWIPAVRDRNIGIWQDISISASGPVVLRNLHIESDLPLPSLDRADVTFKLEAVNLTRSARRGRIRLKLSSPGDPAEIIRLSRIMDFRGEENTTVTFSPGDYPDLHLKNPCLWWPNGMGPQHLYSVQIEIELDREVSHRVLRTFGVREFESRVFWVDEWARREFAVNGRKILIRGGAWVPDMLLGRSTAKLEAELRLSREAGLNLVRIWGGGVTPPESFFSQCDKLGLLVWHDFWITGDCQGTWGKGSKDYPLEGEVFLQNAESVVSRLQTHPSLLLWTAGNEGYPRREIYSPLRNRIAAVQDGTRPFLPSSGYQPPPEEWGLAWPDNGPAGTYSGGPYWWVDPAEYFRLIEGGRDWLFKNEVGIPSLPTYESLAKFIPDLSPDPQVKFPLNHIWGYHDACEGNGKYSLYHEAILNRYGGPEDLSDYLWKGQLLNAESYRGIFEAVNESRDRVSGVILWKTNPSWPSVIWQIYDWYLRPHAGYYAIKNTGEPVHVQINPLDDRVFVINHTQERLIDLEVKANVYNLNSEPVYEKAGRISLDAESSTAAFPLEIPDDIKSQLHFVDLSLVDRSGNLVSGNFYWMSNQNDFSRLNALPEVELDVEYRDLNESDKSVFEIRLRNPSPHLAFFVCPSILAGESGEEILPSFWSDRYFSLPPGRTIKLRVEFPLPPLETPDPYLKLEGWNIHINSIPLNGRLHLRMSNRDS